jgi:general secretion pathway protein A
MMDTAPATSSISATMRLISRYGLTEPPFALSPDPRFLYLTPQHHRALAYTRFSIDDRAGLSVIYADVGHGKSTLARRIYDLYRSEENYDVVLLTNPDLSSSLQLLKRITDTVDLPRRRTKLDQMQEFENYLVDKYAAGRNVVLIVDEAQLLVGPQFELIRQFTNFESASAKLIQIVLIGQNNLRNKLKLKRALLSRAASISTLDPLTPEETKGLIEFRLAVAGSKNPLYEEETIAEIQKITKGVPREIVKRCRTSLLVAAMNGFDTVPVEALEDGGTET